LYLNELIINGDFETGAFPPWTASNETVTNLLSHSGFFSDSNITKHGLKLRLLKYLMYLVLMHI